ncbi:C-type lectin domain protein [Croceitalea dokdonensis DOKDO 023]|uniref:C-type lectin domain protein n=1 Tax=Croceitalea dokdonensis DOKDO 023 TaxID=1300341 RepID=A0A0P7A1F8_9FLAO|nr:C-type lectin domain-containing protein [Croceitalea dokdonensis]KPM30235.1 C-type lectin domain protein [Croceitalea dokdonensis DOKDO 023]
MDGIALKGKLVFGILVLALLGCTSPFWAQTTYGDDFSIASYSNNSGTGNFLGPWTETSDGNNPATGGRIRVNANQLRFRNLRNNRTITRNLDLSPYQSVTLSLDYNRTGGNESLAVQLFDGTTYSTVAVLDGTGSVSYALNQNQISATAGIRIRSNSGDWDNNTETIFVDNILFTAQLPDQPPVLTGSGDQIYCPGGSVPVVESISITDPDDTIGNAVYIQISSGYVNGEDVLTLTGSHPNITPSWNPTEGELTLMGPASYVAFEAAVLATVFSSSSGNPSGTKQFSITVGEPNFLPETQHYYEFVPDPGISWTDARDAAATRTYLGLQGYLVTLTSQEEADFAGQQASGFGWIGATDELVEGEWRWATGPEAGTLFWTGLANGTEITYANWNGGEPNNVGSNGEDYAHIAAASVIRGGAPIGAWNDLPNGGGGGAYASQGYVVEYGGMPGDPVLNISLTTSITVDSEPPTWVTTAGALDQNYQCNGDVPTLTSCSSLNTTFFNQQQFSWGFGLQNSTAAVVTNWEVRITNANYQLDPLQLTNQAAFNYSEVDNGNGTFDLILTGTGPIPGFGGIPGGNIQWSGVNFGFTPTSDGISVFCGATPFSPPVATDNCGNVTVVQVSDVVTNDNGPNDYVRVVGYEAVDDVGNTSSIFTRTITVRDTTAPTASNLAGATVFCASDIPAPDILVVNDEADNCSPAPTVSFVGDISDGGANPEIITRTYAVSDAAGNSIQVTQTFTVNAFEITQQPINFSATAGGSATFMVGASNADTYQWQLSTNGGVSFINLSDTAAYSGTQSPTLSLNAPISSAMQGYQYRVLVSNSNAACPAILSNSAALSVGAATVITNRRITFRVQQ